MGSIVEVVFIRLFWVASFLALIALAVGPARTWSFLRRLWAWVDDRRHEPTVVLTRVVREHEKNIHQLKDVLVQSELAQAEILRNMRKSADNLTALEREAKTMAGADDDLSARAALYKLNLERLPIPVDMDHRSDVADGKARVRQVGRQHDTIMLSNHG